MPDLTPPSREAEPAEQIILDWMQYVGKDAGAWEPRHAMKLRDLIAVALTQRERETAERCAGMAEKHPAKIHWSLGVDGNVERHANHIATAIRKAYQ